MKDEIREMDRLFEERRDIKDQYFQKRAKKEKLQKTGGIKDESPIWNDK